MRTVWIFVTTAAIVVGAGGMAMADPGKDESGKGKWRGEYRNDQRGPYAQQGEYKQEFYQNGCKVKREWKKDGGYEEKVKCDRR